VGHGLSGTRLAPISASWRMLMMMARVCRVPRARCTSKGMGRPFSLAMPLEASEEQLTVASKRSRKPLPISYPSRERD
jgi:hypothetical protein